MLNPIEKTYRRLTEEGREVIKLFSGNPNEQGILFPATILEDSYRAYFGDPHYRPHPKGLAVAREAVARYYFERGFKVDPENILITSGTSESFLQIFSLLAKPGDHFLAPTPSYPLFDDLARMARVGLRHYSLMEGRGWSIDLDGLEADDHSRGLILVSPHNPTGAVHSREEILEAVAWANRQGLPVICDEVFSEFCRDPYPRMAALAKPDLAFTFGGISKMFALPALKLGWIAVTGEKARVAAAVDGLETFNDTLLTCHTPIQEALPRLFQEGKPFLEEYREIVRRRLTLAKDLLNEIPGLRWVEPRGGFYLMAEVLDPQGMGEEEWVIRLMEEKGVFVHPGYFFDYEKGVHFVLSFLTRENDLEKGLRAIKEFF